MSAKVSAQGPLLAVFLVVAAVTSSALGATVFFGPSGPEPWDGNCTTDNSTVFSFTNTSATLPVIFPASPSSNCTIVLLNDTLLPYALQWYPLIAGTGSLVLTAEANALLSASPTTGHLAFGNDSFPLANMTITGLYLTNMCTDITIQERPCSGEMMVLLAAFALPSPVVGCVDLRRLGGDQHRLLE